VILSPASIALDERILAISVSPSGHHCPDAKRSSVS
jgi:hypothetical protein